MRDGYLGRPHVLLLSAHVAVQYDIGSIRSAQPVRRVDSIRVGDLQRQAQLDFHDCCWIVHLRTCAHESTHIHTFDNARRRVCLLHVIDTFQTEATYDILPFVRGWDESVLIATYPRNSSPACWIAGLIHHILRRDYGTMQLYSGNDASSEGMITRTFSWAEDFISHQLCGSSLVFLSALGLICGLPQLLHMCTRTLVPKKKTRVKEKEENSSSEAWKVVLLALIFYLLAFHSLSNRPLSHPLLFGIH